MARPAGLEPATFGSGGLGKEATGGSVEPRPPDFIDVRSHPRPPETTSNFCALSVVCQSFRVRAPYQ